ncbi:ComF family protein [Agromyces kandeliae]|uniref:ComF family protein n=1 Tax=Agromyces kandeliae TaxID=2666141 RepID=A0A6L5QYZ4_9MICO|nr:phosphoribosyltransferase family protein [Agromyces kandeliae]MRX42865.1 ComF family protein [Agromyces kandeliae]
MTPSPHGTAWSGAARAALLDALALLLPVACAACAAPDRGLCAGCRAAIVPRPVRVDRAGAGIATWAALEYAGTPARVIRAFKEEGRTDVARVLGGALRGAIGAAAVAFADGVPREIAVVPSTARARRARGYDPVRMLVSRAGFAPSDVLWAGDRVDQAALGREARRANSDGSFAAPRSLVGRRFLLVDDIVTTGSTLADAVRAIRAAGGSVDAISVLAQTRLRIARGDADA